MMLWTAIGAVVRGSGGEDPARARSMRTGKDDVPDPVGLPVEEHEEAGKLIVAALLPLLRRMADLVTAGPGGPVGRRVITESPQARNAGVSPTT